MLRVWYEVCVISSATEEAKFKIIDIKRYVPAVTLSAQDNAKLFEKLKSCFKRIINRNKYQPNTLTEKQKINLDSLIDSCFQQVNRVFVLSF